MKNVLVTGGKGQLASALKKQTKDWKNHQFIFLDSDQLDITDAAYVSQFFQNNRLAYCINCAAFTHVDKAEEEKAMAHRVNVYGAKVLAESCNTHGVSLLQISTDYVFDGTQTRFYREDDDTNPLNEYGRSKLDGEKAITSILPEHFIIRTSWLYSEYGSNFLKTMLRLGATKKEINVVCDQIGTPTNASDLAAVLVKILAEESEAYGIYHFSNEGVASWYDFAMAIFEESNMKTDVVPIRSDSFPALAIRPAFSVLDKSKVKEIFNLRIPYWRESLIRSIKAINEGK